MKNIFDSLLREAADRADVSPSLNFYVQIWPQLVGPELSRQSRPCALSEDGIVVEVNEAWMKHVEKSRATIERRLGRTLPWEAPTVELIAGYIPPADPEEDQCDVRPPPEPDSEEEAEMLSRLDGELGEVLLQIRDHVRREKGE